MKSTNKNTITHSSLHRLMRLFSLLCCLMFVLTVFAVPAFAAEEGEEGAGGNLGSSSLVTGGKALLADATTVLLIFCPGLGIAFSVYYMMRRSASDEQDGKMWTRRAWIAFGCGIGGGLVSGVLNVVSSYF